MNSVLASAWIVLVGASYCVEIVALVDLNPLPLPLPVEIMIFQF